MLIRKKKSFHLTRIIQIKNISFELKQFISIKKKEETIFKVNCILTKIITKKNYPGYCINIIIIMSIIIIIINGWNFSVEIKCLFFNRKEL